MTRALLPLLLLAACAPGSVTVGEDKAADTATDGDTAEGDADTDADSDADTDADTDTDTDADTDPVLVPDYSHFEGHRRFVADYSDWGYSCDETVGETGEEIEAGSSEWEALSELCGVCDHFYEVTPASESACDGYIQLGTTWRGVVLGDDAAAVYLYRESDGDLEEYGSDDAADFDGTTAEFAYTYYLYGYVPVEISGDMTWELVEQE